MMMAALAPRWRNFGLRAILVTLLIVGAAGCDREDLPDSPERSSATIPDSPLGNQLAWLLGLFEKGGRDVSEVEVADHLNQAFEQQVPPDAFLEIVEQVAVDLDPFMFEGFEGEPSETNAVAIIRNEHGAAFRLTITIEPEPPHLIASALIQPAPDLDEGGVKTWDSVDEILLAAASEVSFLAAELRDDDCLPVHELDSDAPLAIGSAFKLYVLGALAHEIEQGRASWSERLPIRTRLKSIPSGAMREEKPGSLFTLRHFAGEMISVSDNTAADHLLARVGRERVQRLQRAMGNSHAHLNVPFLSTRELSILKLGPDKQATDYLASSTKAKRRLLATEIADAPLPRSEDIVDWTEPKRIDSLEWFASAADLCRAMVHLKLLIERDLHPIKEILATDPVSIGADEEVWSYVGFKGGSEPGVLNLTAQLQRDDDRWFFVSIGLNDQTRNISGLSIQGAMAATLELLGR